MINSIPQKIVMDCKSITDTLARTCQNPADDARSQYFYSHSTQEDIPSVRSR